MRGGKLGSGKFFRVLRQPCHQPLLSLYSTGNVNYTRITESISASTKTVAIHFGPETELFAPMPRIVHENSDCAGSCGSLLRIKQIA